MSEISDRGKEFFEHHGVKGQKWGIRRNPKTGVRPIAQTLNDSAFGRQSQRNVDTHNRRAAARQAKRLAKKDVKWQKNIYTTKSAIEIHNRVADKMNNGGLDKLNNRPEFKGKRMISSTGQPLNTPASKAYFKAYETMNAQFTRDAVKEIHGTSPSGGYKAKLDTSGDQWSIKITPVNIQHADDPFPTLDIDVEWDDNGFITLQSNVKDTLSQSAVEQGAAAIAAYLSVDNDDLEHHGVRGQKWGVRKARLSSADAQRHADNKKRALHELSDKDLRDLVNRMNMEQQAKRMSPNPAKKGHDFVKGILAVAGTVVAIDKLHSSATGSKLEAKIAKAFSGSIKEAVKGIGVTA